MGRSALAAALLGAGLACAPPPLEGRLGNPRNPVRADTFLGELEYLARLRCPDGTQPHFQRLSGTAGRSLRGPCGHFLNGYRVRCIYLNTERRVFLDPHHPGHAEPAGVEGFRVAGPPDRKRLFWFDHREEGAPCRRARSTAPCASPSPTNAGAS